MVIVCEGAYFLRSSGCKVAGFYTVPHKNSATDLMISDIDCKIMIKMSEILYSPEMKNHDLL